MGRKIILIAKINILAMRSFMQSYMFEVGSASSGLVTAIESISLASAVSEVKLLTTLNTSQMKESELFAHKLAALPLPPPPPPPQPVTTNATATNNVVIDQLNVVFMVDSY